MKPFKIRCSAIGKIMTNARSKDQLSKTCQTYLDNWIKEQVYGRRKLVTTKYMDKGNIMEDDAIDMLADHLGAGLLIKNEQSYSDEYMTGTPDVIMDDCIPDVKSSWDFTTFPLLDQKLPNKDYYWQIQGYLSLTNKQKGQIAYCLLNTPMHLIEREARSYCYNNGYGDLDDAILNKYIQRMTYQDIDKKYKIKVFDIDRSDDDIQAIHERVKQCNDYINQRTKDLQIKLK